MNRAWKGPRRALAPLTDELVMQMVAKIRTAADVRAPRYLLTTTRLRDQLAKIVHRHERQRRRFPCLYRPFHPKRPSRMAGK